MNPNDIKIDPKLLSPYNPSETEDRIYKLWEESGFFNPDVCEEKNVTDKNAKPFSIILPPPNVTGTLHIGHAAMLVIEDIMTRSARMQGRPTLWLPGTDHAAIATQSKVEKILEKDGIRKADLGREEFLKKVNAFAQESHDTIVNQVRKMGASVDWSREAFTLDDKRNFAVRTAFKKMYDEGLIYRGHRIVNWDPKGQTVISDDEVVYEERKAKLYTFKYSKDFPISISTTRPETKVGDVAVAVHPDDARYAEYVGKEYDMEFCGVPIHIKIIADTAVEKEFGTGALGVTPAHSQIDSEIATRHKLPTVQVINEFAKMMVGGENLLGKKTAEAREVVALWLNEQGLMEKEEEITQNVSTAERTGAIIEPLPKLQWFINVNKAIPSRGNKTLKELMLEPVKNQKINILPDRFEKVYYNWVENLRDWCISRQIWYGHRIPVWYDKSGGIHLPKEKKIIFVRHGESTGNANNTYAGQQDHDLTEKGISQAKETAEILKKLKGSKIFSSNLTRAKKTAEIIAEAIGSSEISFHPELREVYGGDMEGKTRDLGLLVEVLTHDTGETLEELINRAQKAWDIILASESDDSVIVVGHNSFLLVMKAFQEGLRTKEEFIAYRNKWHMPNAGIYEFNILTDPKGEDLSQDEDTLDTWFSSGLWTFSTLGWPDMNAPDLKKFHPTTVLETGYDIIFFWVARMILMSQYLLGEIPFETVYLHGLVRDAKGRKMSKSLGNIIDPLDMIKLYGADAVRMSLIIGTGPGNDSKLSEDKIKAYKHFANKLWNITRFILSYTQGITTDESFTNYTDADLELIKERDALIADISKEISEYKFYLAGEKLYQYTWSRLADVILEESREILMNGDEKSKNSRAQFLLNTLYKIVACLHPFMPFVTEELWSIIPKKENKLLIVSSWPKK